MTKTFDRTVSIQYLPHPEEDDKSKELPAGKFLFPGFVRLYELASKDIAGKGTRYFTGLEPNEYPEEERPEIQKAKDELEVHFGQGTLDPFNSAFWKGRNIEITRKTTFLNMSDPEDKLKYYLIKGGGFREIAPSYELAISGAESKRWYLVDANQFAEISVEDDRKINKAIAALEMLEEEKGFDDMFIVHKILVSSDRGTTKNSPKAMLYKDLTDFIHGRIVRTNKRETPKQFLSAVDTLKKERKKAFLYAYTKDANYFNFLTVTEDNNLQNTQTKTKLGTSIEKAVQFLSNPANQSEMDNLKQRVEEKWIQ